jgi:hypothetical protein
MQEATTFNIFYDGISFQHLATVLISVFMKCYGTGLTFIVAHPILSHTSVLALHREEQDG